MGDESEVKTDVIESQVDGSSLMSFELSQDELLNTYGDVLVASVLGADEVSLGHRKHLFKQLSPLVFRNENYIIYRILHKFRDADLELDSDFINLFLDNNRDMILKTTNVELAMYGTTPEESTQEFIVSVESKFLKLLSMDSSSNFNLDVEKYRIEYLASESRKDLANAQIILDTGMKVNRRLFQGSEDSQTYLRQRWTVLDSVRSGVGTGVTVYGDNDDDEDVVSKHEVVGSYVLDELNAHFDYIYTGDMISILAPTKGGKTKYSSAIIHESMVVHGTSCVVWAVEGGKKAWEAQLRARHFDYVYNKDVTDPRQKRLGLSVQVIKNRKYPSDELRQLEEASWLDLKTNPNYGKLIIIDNDRDFEAETFVDEVDTAVQMIDAKLVCVDYIQLIMSKKLPKKNERIGLAYQLMLKYLKKHNVAGIFPAQYAQDFVDELSKSLGDGKSKSSSVEARTGGGESAEVVRTPDINIGLYASAEDLMRGSMSFISIPSRNASPFPKFECFCDLSVNLFASIRKET